MGESDRNRVWRESVNPNRNQCNSGVSCQTKEGVGGWLGRGVLAALFQISALVSATSSCREFLLHILRSPKPHRGIFLLCSH